MKACIVGHGPSMLRHLYGESIDSHDIVIRLKKSQHLLQVPKIFGTKTDITCGSFFTNTDLVVPQCRRYWLFIDTRTESICDQAVMHVRARFAPNTCLVDRALCTFWMNHYRAMREKMDFDARQEKKASTFGGKEVILSDDLGHKHCSAGMFAIIYALAHLQPKVLNLYGFDNVMNGTFDWSLTRGEEWKAYPDHNWKTESRMLDDVAKHYGYRAEKQKEVLCVSAM